MHVNIIWYKYIDVMRLFVYNKYSKEMIYYLVVYLYNDYLSERVAHVVDLKSLC